MDPQQIIIKGFRALNMDRLKFVHLKNSRGPCDISLVAKNGKQFEAHRQILSEASPFFEKLFSSDMKESRDEVVQLHFTQSQMADILEFIYTGSIQISNLQKAEDLITAADYLFLERLKFLAQKFIAQNLSTANCISYYYLAEKFNSEELTNSSRKFIHLNFSTVAESEEFLNLPSDEVAKWISSDHIVISEEEDVFKILLKWVNQGKSQRGVKFGELFRHVRLTCMSRDFLVTDVVANDLVNDNRNCLDSVTSTLKWIDRATDCHVSRPHRPRKVLESTVIAACGVLKPFESFCYLPEKDDWYRFPTFECQEHPFCGRIKRVVPYRGQLYAIFDCIYKSKCYDPDLNLWYPAPWEKRRDRILIEVGEIVDEVLVVKNEMCFISQFLVRNYKTPPGKLCKYNLESDSISLPQDWVNRQSSSTLACDKYIFAIGGYMLLEGNEFSVRSEAARFDVVENKWQEIAPIQEARFYAFGVVANNKIFIAGGVGKNSKQLKTCEVYNMFADEWQSIASLTVPRNQGHMVLVNETLYVLGGCSQGLFTPLVECYDHEKDQWNKKTLTPSCHNTRYPSFTYKATSLNVFNGSLNNLNVVGDIGSEMKS